MNIFIVLVTILGITLVGYTLIRLLEIFGKKDILLSISYGYGLGMALAGLQLYFYARLDIPWHREFLLIPWVIFLVTVFLNKKNIFYVSSQNFLKPSVLQILLLVGICLSGGYVFFEALLRPVTVWDGWAIWLLKSKVFFIDGTIRPESLAYVSADYPLLISLLGTFIYIMVGYVNDTIVLLSSFAFYIFLAIAFFATLKKKFGITYALFFTFLLVTTQNFVRHGGRMESGQADLPLAYFIFTSSMLLLSYYKNTHWKTLLLTTVFLGITGLIKIEGMPFTLTIGIFLSYMIIKKKNYTHFIFFLFWVLPIIDWYTYKSIYHLAALTTRTFSFSLQKTFSVFLGVGKELVNIKTWSMLWICYLYMFFCWPKKGENTFFIINIIIFSQFGLYCLIYLFIDGYSPDSSIERLLLHLAPLVLYAIAIRVKQLV